MRDIYVCARLLPSNVYVLSRAILKSGVSAPCKQAGASEVYGGIVKRDANILLRLPIRKIQRSEECRGA